MLTSNQGFKLYNFYSSLEYDLKASDAKYVVAVRHVVILLQGSVLGPSSFSR